jgi:hypothetical protein
VTVVSDRIVALASYAWNDWAITGDERRQILQLLRGDADMPGTLRDLQAQGYLTRIFHDFVTRNDGGVAPLLQVLGAGAGTSAGLVEAYRGWTPRQLLLFRLSRDLHASYRRIDARLGAASFNPATGADLLPSGDTAAQQPFGGVGATGVPATSLSVPLGDQLWMKFGDAATLRRYKNPIPGDLGAYLDGLSASQRLGQARRLVGLPINSVVPQSYLRGLPSRAAVMRAAGRVYRLDPALIAGFILAEQRDQSRNEDAVDYASAVHPLARHNSSIGLGQVVVTTAQRHDLFSRLLGTVRLSLDRNQVAELLVSEEFNIFAVAKYIRLTADGAAGRTRQQLPNTVAAFPRIDFAAYARPSEAWPEDNIRALGSEYTSTAWDDRVTGWGFFVFEAWRDMAGTGLFG